jgi:hypothetical protein
MGIITMMGHRCFAAGSAGEAGALIAKPAFSSGPSGPHAYNSVRTQADAPAAMRR